ncbi:DegT/DnrJ/EryC1/StrS family aminotransferase [uncultured Fretibacterium sp.]|uniref:DegT/DnrJ/EryC1/StrS family aminotransferase n=1 Tax=uncultured Fretibacterium sp. TaxID=1678694 RepID=UPI00260F3F17|nr:DegT/DnrJ/EryC1/StrS family aminotransferase [uncultured Fretibacterium sp.]
MNVPVNEPLLNGNEKKYLDECIDTGWISSEGPFVTRLEEGMCRLTGRKHGAAVCNGTVALELALQALDLTPGSEVIMPTFTIISCASAIVRAGCVPVLVDSDPLTWNMDLSQVEARITPRTAAIMAVHLYGLPVDMKPLMALAQKHHLAVIEDAAEAIGQTAYDTPCGAFGDISCFSFYPNKHVTTGEGGMVLCDNDALAARCRSLRNLSFVPERRFVHRELGHNFRISNIQAAIGVAQMEKLPESLRKKRAIGTRYQELLKDVQGVQLPLERTPYAENLYWVFGLVLNDEIPFEEQECERRLQALGIGTRPFFWPMHEQPVFLEQGLFKGERYPVAERIARRGLYVPTGLALTDEAMRYVSEQVHAVLGTMER